MNNALLERFLCGLGLLSTLNFLSHQRTRRVQLQALFVFPQGVIVFTIVVVRVALPDGDKNLFYPVRRGGFSGF